MIGLVYVCVTTVLPGMLHYRLLVYEHTEQDLAMGPTSRSLHVTCFPYWSINPFCHRAVAANNGGLVLSGLHCFLRSQRCRLKSLDPCECCWMSNMCTMILQTSCSSVPNRQTDNIKLN